MLDDNSVVGTERKHLETPVALCARISGVGKASNYPMTDDVRSAKNSNFFTVFVTFSMKLHDFS